MGCSQARAEDERSPLPFPVVLHRQGGREDLGLRREIVGWRCRPELVARPPPARGCWTRTRTRRISSKVSFFWNASNDFCWVNC